VTFKFTSDKDGLAASDSGAVILDHGMWIDSVCGSGKDDGVLSLTRCSAVAARLRRNGTWITTLGGEGGPGGPNFPDSVNALIERLLLSGGPANAYDMPKKDDKDWWTPLTAAQRRRLPSSADFAAVLGDSASRSKSCQFALLSYVANLPELVGPDWPMGGLGSGVHWGLLRPVLCGVPALWALQTATLNPARALHLTDSLGTVAVGKVADLVLLDGDPLEDIGNVSQIQAVVANGRYYDRAALDGLLRAAAAEWNLVAASDRRVEAERTAKKKVAGSP
jgi:hypothetical protein